MIFLSFTRIFIYNILEFDIQEIELNLQDKSI